MCRRLESIGRRDGGSRSILSFECGRAGLPHDFGDRDLVAGQAAGRRRIRAHRICVQCGFPARVIAARQQRRDCRPRAVAASPADSSAGRSGSGVQDDFRADFVFRRWRSWARSPWPRPTRESWRLYGTMLFTTAIGLDFVFRGTERMGLVAVSLCVRTAIYAFGVLCPGARCEPDRLGADLADGGRAERDCAGLAQLSEALSAAPAAVEPAILVRLGAARTNRLLDPAFTGGDQHGGSARCRVPERFERRWPLRGAAPDGDGAA